jgi:hypothetical protein
MGGFFTFSREYGKEELVVPLPVFELQPPGSAAAL